MKRLRMMLLAVLLLFAACTGCAETYQKEENTGRDKDTHPWLIRTPSAVWHLAKSDIELLGEEAYFEGLYKALENMEADFADAREALKGYIPDEIPPVDIYTDFCNKARFSETSGAVYRKLGNYIKVFFGWDAAGSELQHEYVHYLSMNCAENAASSGFWGEGIADYVTRYICKNRLLRAVYKEADLSAEPPEKVAQVRDPEDGCLDPRLLHIGNARTYVLGKVTGQKYKAVNQTIIIRTEEIQNEPDPEELSYEEASGMVAYLVETFGRDTVFGNWNLDTDKMETVFGKPYAELYRDWAAWNEEQCRELGFTFSDSAT